ncbi:MAG: aminomethyl-transferring glycine dehydrogenase subunit GcvPB [Candidatus Alcyoniella australis]|nr:aminomethyl-transferring glycine dehydrogenase subunit GcvPB [Candidatus Alcyoniella australis]
MSKSSTSCELPAGFPGTVGLKFNEPLIFERSVPGRIGHSLPALDVPTANPALYVEPELLRGEAPALPEVSEIDAVRHFHRLSGWNYAVDSGMYPLGSCTMKYNPRVNEATSRLPGLARLHPLQPVQTAQGALSLMHELSSMLAEISGMHAVTLQPAAGAHGEFSGLLMIRAYHTSRGNPRSKVLIPDSAHGTNPASAALCNYKPIELKSGPDGLLDPYTVAAAMDEEVAALMITNPNTLGLFERNILEIAKIVHDKGGLIYCDGANLNALMGAAKPAHFGADVLHFNLHKTFSTPHGGGGPGSGPVGVVEALEPFLPSPVVVKSQRDGADYYELDYDRPQSVGRVKAFYGNFLVMVRAYTYIRELGGEGLTRSTQMAVLNANYVKERLKEVFSVAHDATCMHECVFSEQSLVEHGCHTMDLAKRLIDYGYHPPTVYFPLIVKGAIMIEPTESESVESLEQFIEAMLAIQREAQTDPELLHSAPHCTRLGRLDEVRAVKDLDVRWTKR